MLTISPIHKITTTQEMVNNFMADYYKHLNEFEGHSLWTLSKMFTKRSRFYAMDTPDGRPAVGRVEAISAARRFSRMHCRVGGKNDVCVVSVNIQRDPVDGDENDDLVEDEKEDKLVDHTYDDCEECKDNTDPKDNDLKNKNGGQYDLYVVFVQAELIDTRRMFGPVPFVQTFRLQCLRSEPVRLEILSTVVKTLEIVVRPRQRCENKPINFTYSVREKNYSVTPRSKNNCRTLSSGKKQLNAKAEEFKLASIVDTVLPQLQSTPIGEQRVEIACKMSGLNATKDLSENKSSGQMSNKSSGQWSNESSGQKLNETREQRSIESSGQRWNQTSGQRSKKSSGQRWNYTSRQRSNESSGQRWNDTSGQWANESSGQRWNEMSGQRSNESSGQRSNESSGQRSNDMSGQKSSETSGERSNETGRQWSNKMSRSSRSKESIREFYAYQDKVKAFLGSFTGSSMEKSPANRNSSTFRRGSVGHTATDRKPTEVSDFRNVPAADQLYIFDLEESITASELYITLRRYGKIISSRVVPLGQRPGHRVHRMGIVRFERTESVEQAMADHERQGCAIRGFRLSFSKTKPDQ